MDSYALEASNIVQTSLGSTMGEISVVETDSQTPKTDRGTVADPQQTASEPQAESLGVADNLNPKDSAEGTSMVSYTTPVRPFVSALPRRLDRCLPRKHYRSNSSEEGEIKESSPLIQSFPEMFGGQGPGAAVDAFWMLREEKMSLWGQSHCLMKPFL